MDSYMANLTNDLREGNKRLTRENLELKQEATKLKEYIKVLEKSDYVNELEANISELQNALELERKEHKKLKDELQVLSIRLDEFLALFASYVNEENAEKYALSEDKSLMFGININATFLKNATIKAISSYLLVMKCDIIEQFIINDFNTTKKSDITLIGEVFADYVRLNNLARDINIYGLIELKMPDILHQNEIVIYFYGNKSIKEDFEKFREIYSSELKLT